jgi:hypothetical protein
LDAEAVLRLGLTIGHEMATVKTTAKRSDIAKLVVLRTLAALGITGDPAAKGATPRRRGRPPKAPATATEPEPLGV